jgi:hypothetical protein
MWRWRSPAFVCQNLQRTIFRVDKVELKIVDVMLESIDCQLIQMEILECSYETIPNISETVDEAPFKYARGVNGEVYAVHSPNEPITCDDQTILNLTQCVNNGTFPVDFSEIEELFFNNREGKFHHVNCRY